MYLYIKLLFWPDALDHRCQTLVPGPNLAHSGILFRRTRLYKFAAIAQHNPEAKNLEKFCWYFGMLNVTGRELKNFVILMH